MVTLVSSTSVHTINREGKTNKHLSFFPKQHNIPTSHRMYHVLDTVKKSGEEEMDRWQADTSSVVRFERL